MTSYWYPSSISDSAGAQSLKIAVLLTWLQLIFNLIQPHPFLADLMENLSKLSSSAAFADAVT